MSVMTMAMVAATNSVIAAGVGDDQQHLRREQREAAADEVDAGRDHRRGVDEGADRRRAFHRVGQPHVQRELRRLADAAEEDAQPGRRPAASRASSRTRRRRSSG